MIENLPQLNNYFVRPDKVLEPLHVIAVVFNPVRFRSRWALYQKFKKQVEDSGAILHTVECAFGERLFTITEPNNPLHLQVRTRKELWIKENLINLAIQRLPSDWKYVAWVDADVFFTRPDWVGETIQQLQHYDVVQMFSEAQDLSPDYEPFARHMGFVYSYRNQIPMPKVPGYYFPKAQPSDNILTWHPGFAWAARREAIDAIGGLFEIAILGAGDNTIAKCLVGDGKYSYHPDMNSNYGDAVMEYQRKCLLYIRKNIGYVSGLLLHYWHGRKSDRKYWDRWKILTENQFDPILDIKKDHQGLLQLEDRYEDRSIKLRDQIRYYFRQRNEDDLYLPEDETSM